MLTIREENGVTTIGFEVEYDALNEASMDRTRAELWSAAQDLSPRVLCDFSRTKYFGSAFIELLTGTWQRVKARGGQMVLCGLQPFCKKVLTVANLDEVWEMYDSRAEAIAALEQD